MVTEGVNLSPQKMSLYIKYISIISGFLGGFRVFFFYKMTIIFVVHHEHLQFISMLEMIIVNYLNLSKVNHNCGQNCINYMYTY